MPKGMVVHPREEAKSAASWLQGLPPVSTCRLDRLVHPVNSILQGSMAEIAMLRQLANGVVTGRLSVYASCVDLALWMVPGSRVRKVGMQC